MTRIIQRHPKLLGALLALAILPFAADGAGGKSWQWSQGILKALFTSTGAGGTVGGVTVPTSHYYSLMGTCPGTSSNAVGIEFTTSTGGSNTYTRSAAVANSAYTTTAAGSSVGLVNYSATASQVTNTNAVAPSTASYWTAPTSGWTPCCFGIHSSSTVGATTDLLMWGVLTGATITNAASGACTGVSVGAGAIASFPANSITVGEQ